MRKEDDPKKLSWKLFYDIVTLHALTNTSAYYAMKEAKLNVPLRVQYTTGDHVDLGKSATMGQMIGAWIVGKPGPLKPAAPEEKSR